METTDRAIKNQVIDTVKDMYLKELNNEYTGFLGVTCHDLLKHLINRYMNIMTTELESKN